MCIYIPSERLLKGTDLLEPIHCNMMTEVNILKLSNRVKTGKLKSEAKKQEGSRLLS